MVTISWEYFLNLLNSNKLNNCFKKNEENKRHKISIRRLKTHVLHRRANSIFANNKKKYNK